MKKLVLVLIALVGMVGSLSAFENPFRKNALEEDSVLNGDNYSFIGYDNVLAPEVDLEKWLCEKFIIFPNEVQNLYSTLWDKSYEDFEKTGNISTKMTNFMRKYGLSVGCQVHETKNEYIITVWWVFSDGATSASFIIDRSSF